MPEPKLIKNKIACLVCGDIIESTYQYDFKMCSCGKVGVDGGLEYMRRLGDQRYWKEMSVYEHDGTEISANQLAESFKKVEIADRIVTLDEELTDNPNIRIKVQKSRRGGSENPFYNSGWKIFNEDPIDKIIDQIKQI